MENTSSGLTPPGNNHGTPSFDWLKLPGAQFPKQSRLDQRVPLDQNTASILLLLTSEAVTTAAINTPHFAFVKTEHVSIVNIPALKGLPANSEIVLPREIWENISGTLANYLVNGLPS